MLTEYMIKRMGMKLGIQPTAREERDAQKKKPIPKVSDKMKVKKLELKKLYPAYLKANPSCAIQGPHCTIKATCVNHTRGRGEKELLDQSTWEPSCIHCNTWIESNPTFNEGKHKQSPHIKNKQ